MEKTNQRKGFTIIEVVLVLAIAGLIFLMVFVALPALQRNQRDTQRRQDFANLEASIENYIANNNGRLPAITATNGIGTLPANQYINSTGQAPDGANYTLQIRRMTGTGAVTAATVPDLNTVWVVIQADCGGTSTNAANAGGAAPRTNNSSRRFAVYGRLEGGVYCQDNS